MTASEARDLVYTHNWGAARSARLAILQAVFTSHTSLDDLPKNALTVGWTYQGVAFKLLPFHAPPELGLHGSKGRGRARFLMVCPECRNWYSVGKFMLHTKVHRIAG